MKQQIIDSIEYINNQDTSSMLTFGYGFMLNVAIWFNVFNSYLSN